MLRTERTMHRLTQDHLEELLEGQTPPASVAAHMRECTECREEVDSMRWQNDMLRSFLSAAPGDDASTAGIEPRPGFYARVLERIEAQRPVSIWALFTESLAGRRLATASLAMALFAGAFIYTVETAPVARQTAMVDPLYPTAGFATEAMLTESGDGAVFASLVSYRAH